MYSLIADISSHFVQNIALGMLKTGNREQLKLFLTALWAEPGCGENERYQIRGIINRQATNRISMTSLQIFWAPLISGYSHQQYH